MGHRTKVATRGALASPGGSIEPRLQLVEKLLSWGKSEDFVVEEGLRQGWPVTRSTILGYVVKVRERWRILGSASAAERREEARQRIMGALAQATKDRSWTAVATLERLLMDMDGTRRQVDRVEVAVTHDVPALDELVAKVLEHRGSVDASRSETVIDVTPVRLIGTNDGSDE